MGDEHEPRGCGVSGIREGTCSAVECESVAPTALDRFGRSPSAYFAQKRSGVKCAGLTSDALLGLHLAAVSGRVGMEKIEARSSRKKVGVDRANWGSARFFGWD